MTDQRHTELLALVKNHIDFVDAENAYCYEIGDGSVNYIYRIEDIQGNSVIVKHADKAAKSDGELLLSTHRLEIEYQQLSTLGQILPNFVPEVYHYDSENHMLIMEDLKDYEILKVALNDYKKFPHFAAQISRYLFSTLVCSTDLVAPSRQKKMALHSLLNPEMAEMTENRIFGDPYNHEKAKNYYLPENDAFFKDLIFENKQLLVNVGLLKYRFKNLSQSILHGELHTGNIFINQENIKVFDPEFAMYGPMGYDIGTLLGSMIVPWIHAYLAEREGKEDFTFWIEETIERIFSRFYIEYDAQFDTIVTDPMAKVEGFKEAFWEKVRTEILGFTGIELIQETMLSKKIQEATRQDPEQRQLLERLTALVGVHLIENRETIETGKQMCSQIKTIIEEKLSEIAEG